MKLQSADLALLRDLLAVVQHPAQPCFLVGAGARVLGLDERFGIPGARATLDWDFAVRVSSWPEWELLRARLLEAPGSPFRATSAQHRLEHTLGRQLDLVPFGGLETGTGEIVWPDATRMTVHGFAEAAVHCSVIEIERGLLVHVASLPSLALLKLHAYLDRRTKGVTKDIQDFDWIARHYDFPSDHELRIHDELAERLIASGTEFSEAGAMLLGVDVAKIHSMAAIAPVRRLLTESLDPHSRVIEDVMKVARVLDDERRQEQRARVVARMQAFGRGLGEDRAS